MKTPPQNVAVTRAASWLLRLAPLFVLVWLSLAAIRTADAAIEPQFQCTPIGSTTGAKCQPPLIGPWKWRDYDLGYSRQLSGYYDSLSAIASAIDQYVEANSSWCNLNHLSTAAPTNQLFTYNILRSERYKLRYSYNYHKPTCANFADSYYPEVTRLREVSCPKGGWALKGDVAAAIDAYCACPWGSECAPKLCPNGEVRKGNPCEITSRRKVQVERDYVGNGPFPLSFTRTYDSKSAYEYNIGGQPTPPREYPLGIGWAGSYLQRLHYSNEGEVAGLWAIRPDGSVVPFAETAPGVFSHGGEIRDRVETVLDGMGIPIGWAYITAGELREIYDIGGKLIRIESPNGGTQTLSYDSANKLAGVTDAFGRTLGFIWGTDGKIAKLVLPDASEILYAFDTGGKSNLVTVTYATAHTRQYHYELTSSRVNLLTGITDESATRFATFGYTTSGLASSTQHAGGVDSYTIAYVSQGANVTDPLGTTRLYTNSVVNTVRRNKAIASTCGGCNEPKSRTYDNYGNVTSSKDFNDRETIYAFDTARTLEISRTEAFGTAKARTITTTWHATQRLPTLITEPNRTTAMTYDTLGNWLTRTITNTATGATRVWTRTFDSYGRVLTEDGPRTDVSDVTTYTYHTCTTGFQCGQLATVTNALGQVTTYTSYNAHGQPLSITDPNGVVTTMTYDLRQRLTSRTTGGETTTLEYWPTGLLKKVIQPDASFVLYTYDAAQRLIRIEDNLGNRVDYTLDNMGNRTAENARDPSSSLRRTHSQVFNTLNYLWKDVNAAGTAAVTTVFGYDTNGNPTTTAAPLSRTTTNAYDELNRLSQVTDPATGVTQFGYDANDNLTSVLDPKGLTTTYTHNGFGDQLTQVSPDTGTTTNTYDSAGNLSTSTDARSAVATYSYDSMNRVTQVAYGDQTLVYGYDAGTNGTGRLTSASDALHTMSWTYDSLGRVTGKGQTVGGTTLSIGYGYLSGRLATTTLPSGQVLSYSYNSAGQITGVSVGATTILSGALYEPFGPVRQWTWGNSTLAVRTFDTDYKVTQIDSGGFKTLGYDDALRITSITDAANANLSWAYGYDSLDRLTSATSTPTTRGWTYDANGNRLTESGSAPSTFTYAVSPSSNRIASISGSLPRTYGYDAAGNTTGFAAASFTYNNRGRMATATYSGTTANYVYNALGQRIRRIVPSATTLYVYDEAGHVVGEYNSAGALIQETVWMGDIPVATLRPKVGGGVDVFYVHTDHLDTPRVITQPSNNAERWRWDSDPFGTNLPNENPSGAGTFVYNLRFPGQQFDGLVGMHYNYFRDYDASTGRYFESDPIGLDGGINTFGYASGNPIGFTDHFGLEPKGGERGATGGVGGRNTDNPYKHCREYSPPQRGAVECKHHQTGKWIRKPRPPEMPFPGDKREMCGDECKDTAATVVFVGGTAYVVYRCVRMVPSLFPPLWPTIPANLAVP